MNRPLSPVLMVAAALLCVAGACGKSERPSPAADDVIAKSSNAEEREGLTRARDDIDEGMRRAVAEKDAEIERLRKENDELRKKLDRK